MCQARTACLPIVSASLLMMQPPVKTSAVRASTYSPLTLLPPAIIGETARPTSAAITSARCISNLRLQVRLLVRFHYTPVKPLRLKPDTTDDGRFGDEVRSGV